MSGSVTMRAAPAGEGVGPRPPRHRGQRGRPQPGCCAEPGSAQPLSVYRPRAASSAPGPLGIQRRVHSKRREEMVRNKPDGLFPDEEKKAKKGKRSRGNFA